jgi:hypothetical protein
LGASNLSLFSTSLMSDHAIPCRHHSNRRGAQRSQNNRE